MILRISMDTVPALTVLASQLWPNAEKKELEEEISQAVSQDTTGMYFMYLEDKEAVGFAHCRLRRDYVEGSTTSPVAYLEEMYIDPKWRGAGRATELLKACEEWAREQGCTEFASDCYMDGDFESKKAFHEACGFTEVNRIVCYIKSL